MINYWELFAAWRRLRTLQYTPVEKLHDYQLQRFQRLVRHAYQRIPIYRDLYHSHRFDPASIRTYDDIEQVPVITKGMIRSVPLKDRIDARLASKEPHKDRSSGSTGEPTEIWSTQTNSLIESLKGVRLFLDWGYSPLDVTVRLWRPDIQLTHSLLQKFGLFRRTLVSILDDPDQIAARLQGEPCDVLLGMRSSLEIVGEELKRRGGGLSPRFIVSCGEVLTAEHRKFFREAYGCPTLEIYSSMEIGSIAWSCPVYPSNLHVEMASALVNIHNVHASPEGGKEGSLIATNLDNYLMPFIRYDQGDTILLPEQTQCACGRTLPLLGRVMGRIEDVIEYGGRKFNWQFFRNFINNYMYIRRYKVVQTATGKIEFRIQLFQDTLESRGRCQSDLLNDLGAYFQPLNIVFVDGFPLHPSGKFKTLEKEKTITLKGVESLH